MEDKSSGYGKRPLWQWILLYLVIGGIVYYLIYMFLLKPQGGYNYGSSSTAPTTNYKY